MIRRPEMTRVSTMAARAIGRLAAHFKPGSRHRVVRVADVLELEAFRQVAADRIGATVSALVDAGAEH